MPEIQPKPVNPEAAAVSINAPRPAPAPISRMVSEKGKKPKGTRFLIGCAGGFFLLFALFVVLMILLISRVGANNPVMQALGLDPAGMKNFLLVVISFAFGSLSLFFFILAVVGFFRLLSAKKGDREMRGKGARMMFLSGIPLVAILLLWVFLYGAIARISIAAQDVVAEISVISPADMDHLVAPVEITFSAQKVATALANQRLRIEAMSWDLDGDGAFETPVSQPEVSHLYNLRGVYNVGLQVKVANENVPRPPYLYTFQIPDATFAADPVKGTAPLTVQFDASSLLPRGFRLASLDWDFEDDGKYDLTGKDFLRPTRLFDKIGIYHVHLRVIDQQNNVENYYRDIEIVPSDVPLLTAVAEATPSLSGAAPLRLRFDGSASRSEKGVIVKYEWDFGDGTDIQGGKSVTHVFDKPGIYTVTLQVTENSGLTAETTLQVQTTSVTAVPEAKIITDPAVQSGKLSGFVPFKVSFDASSSEDADKDIVGYSWDFDGDGQVDQEGEKLIHIFDKAGSFLVRLKVTDSQNQTNEATLAVDVAEPTVQAFISADPEEGTAPLVVQFDGSSSRAFKGNIVAYEWDFGDKSPVTVTSASISHKYSEVGTYTVALKVTTNQGENSIASKTIYVREIPLRSCFTASRRNGPAPLAVTFDPKCATGGIAIFHWDFGDGSESASRKPSHTFEKPGTYTVTLEVEDAKRNVDRYTDVIVAEGDVLE